MYHRWFVCLFRAPEQKLASLFMSSGFTSLQEFSELDEEDLDDLHVVQSEDRAKLLTAAQLLHDYENEGLTCAPLSLSSTVARCQLKTTQPITSQGLFLILDRLVN